MKFALRPYHFPEDDAGVAALSAASYSDPWTVADIEDWRRTFPADGLEHDVVAADADHEIVGTAHAYRYPWTPPGQFTVNVLVHPHTRNQGLGKSLFSEVMEFTRRHEASLLNAIVREDDDAALYFAKSLGFEIARHECESRVDLSGWQARVFDGKTAELEASGMRFFTYADMPCETDLYELAKRNAPDLPGFNANAGYPPLDEWRKRWLEDADSPLDCIIIAAIGEQLVGVTRFGKYNEAGAMKTWHTSVLREHRGKGIAEALKLFSIKAALRYGAPTLLADNDSRNTGILRVNAKLGFEPMPGVYYVQRTA
jgi:GNAT superfamily N-acetyltransferase